MDFEQRDDVSEEEYIEMIRLKTAVLIACCIKTGAIIGGASEKDAEHLYRFGIYTGLAFQLQDDLLDVYGDPQTFGKNIGGDILCDKKTFLLINAMMLASDAQKDQMAYFKNPANRFTPEDKITAYTSIYDQLHIKDITQQKMNSLYELAIQELMYLNVAPESLTEIKNMSNLLMQRES
jgi:geranylgeranyl diphosphate synthase type II